MRRLRCGFQRRNTEDVRAIYSRRPDQFYTFAKVSNELASTQLELHDINHFPIAILAGVEAVALQAAVGLLFDPQPNTRSRLIKSTQLFVGIERTVAKTRWHEQRNQTNQRRNSRA